MAVTLACVLWATHTLALTAAAAVATCTLALGTVTTRAVVEPGHHHGSIGAAMFVANATGLGLLAARTLPHTPAAHSLGPVGGFLLGFAVLPVLVLTLTAVTTTAAHHAVTEPPPNPPPPPGVTPPPRDQ